MAKKNEVTFSNSSDRHKEHKHLFNSSSNSDFIINMSAEGARKLCGVYSMIAMILIALSSVPYYISKAMGSSGTYSMLHNDSNDTAAFLIMTLLICAGFIGMLIFMICCVKKEIVIQNNKAAAVFVAILISAVVSALASEDLLSSILGYLDRAEGLVTIIGYIGFYAIGATLTDAKWRRRAAQTAAIIGTVNGLMGILQSIPACSKFIPSYYNYLFMGYRTEVEFAGYFNAYGAYDPSYAADGFACSPFALGALLTVCCAFALGFACFGGSAKRRILNLAAAGIMTGAAILTQTFPAMLGIGADIVIMLVFAIAAAAKDKPKGDEKPVGKTPVLMSAASVVIAAAIALGITLTGNFRMRNERIIFTDAFERLSIAFDIHSEHEDNIFFTLWSDGSFVFEDNMVIGTGPDNWAKMYNDGDGMETDRSYNEYLDIAITRGIIGAALYILMLIITLMKMVRMIKAAFAKREGVEYAAALGAATALLAYMAQAFFNISSNYCTPFFYLTVGMIWSYEAAGKLGVSEAKKEAKKS